MSDKLTKKEVCGILKISPATLGRLMLSGKIKFEKVRAERFASAVFFDRADVEKLLPSSEQPTAPAPPAPKPKLAPAPVKPQDNRTWAEKFKDSAVPTLAATTFTALTINSHRQVRHS